MEANTPINTDQAQREAAMVSLMTSMERNLSQQTTLLSNLYSNSQDQRQDETRAHQKEDRESRLAALGKKGVGAITGMGSGLMRGAGAVAGLAAKKAKTGTMLGMSPRMLMLTAGLLGAVTGYAPAVDFLEAWLNDFTKETEEDAATIDAMKARIDNLSSSGVLSEKNEKEIRELYVKMLEMSDDKEGVVKDIIAPFVKAGDYAGAEVRLNELRKNFSPMNPGDIAERFAINNVWRFVKKIRKSLAEEEATEEEKRLEAIEKKKEEERVKVWKDVLRKAQAAYKAIDDGEFVKAEKLIKELEAEGFDTKSLRWSLSSAKIRAKKQSFNRVNEKINGGDSSVQLVGGSLDDHLRDPKIEKMTPRTAGKQTKKEAAKHLAKRSSKLAGKGLAAWLLGRSAWISRGVNIGLMPLLMPTRLGGTPIEDKAAFEIAEAYFKEKYPALWNDLIEQERIIGSSDTTIEQKQQAYANAIDLVNSMGTIFEGDPDMYLSKLANNMEPGLAETVDPYMTQTTPDHGQHVKKPVMNMFRNMMTDYLKDNRSSISKIENRKKRKSLWNFFFGRGGDEEKFDPQSDLYYKNGDMAKMDQKTSGLQTIADSVGKQPIVVVNKGGDTAIGGTSVNNNSTSITNMYTDPSLGLRTDPAMP